MKQKEKQQKVIKKEEEDWTDLEIEALARPRKKQGGQAQKEKKEADKGEWAIQIPYMNIVCPDRHNRKCHRGRELLSSHCPSCSYINCPIKVTGATQAAAVPVGSSVPNRVIDKTEGDGTLKCPDDCAWFWKGKCYCSHSSVEAAIQCEGGKGEYYHPQSGGFKLVAIKRSEMNILKETFKAAQEAVTKPQEHIRMLEAEVKRLQDATHLADKPQQPTNNDKVISMIEARINTYKGFVAYNDINIVGVNLRTSVQELEWVITQLREQKDKVV